MRRRAAGGAGAARRVALRAVLAVETQPAVRLGFELRRARLEPRDRALANELAHGVIRRQRLLDFVLEPLAPRGLPADPHTRCALRLGAYQLLFLSRVPPHAAVDESVALARPRGKSFVNAVLRRLTRMIVDGPVDTQDPALLVLDTGRSVRLERPLPDPRGRAFADHVAIRCGLPTFLVAGWIEAYGPERASSTAAASAVAPSVHLRALTSRISRDDLAAALDREGVATVPAEHPSMLRFGGGASPFATEAFRDGLFVVQDPTAVRAAEALRAAPGESILDLCAAPGTKATLLAEQVGASGAVFAFDVDAERRPRIVENAERLRLPQLRVVSDLAAIDRPVDKVLVDAPCSNTGVLARRVEMRLRLRDSDPRRFAELQRSLLEQAFAQLRDDAGDGVRVVYSTCSLEPVENRDLVEPVAAALGAELCDAQTVFPEPPEHDGGFWACLGAPTSRGAGSRSGAS